MVTIVPVDFIDVQFLTRPARPIFPLINNDFGHGGFPFSGNEAFDDGLGDTGEILYNDGLGDSGKIVVVES